VQYSDRAKGEVRVGDGRSRSTLARLMAHPKKILLVITEFEISSKFRKVVEVKFLMAGLARLGVMVILI